MRFGSEFSASARPLRTSFGFDASPSLKYLVFRSRASQGAWMVLIIEKGLECIVQ